MRKFAPLFAAIVFAASPVLAADANVRLAQEKLSALGFYTGAVDGELDVETKSALRRFQIYKGLNVSGTLDSQTRAALDKEEGEDDREVLTSVPSVPPPSTQESDREFLEREQPRTAPATQAQPPPPTTPTEQWAALTAEEARFFTEWYRKTPYQTAPAEVQQETFRKARALLTGRGLYEGAETTLPGPEMEEALFRYQSSRGLRLTGRLDLETLAALRLLPDQEREQAPPPASAAALKPFVNDAPADRTPATPSGAVRGIPLD